jgi:hypothetical protein
LISVAVVVQILEVDVYGEVLRSYDGALRLPEGAEIAHCLQLDVNGRVFVLVGGLSYFTVLLLDSELKLERVLVNEEVSSRLLNYFDAQMHYCQQTERLIVSWDEYVKYYCIK